MQSSATYDILVLSSVIYRATDYMKIVVGHTYGRLTAIKELADSNGKGRRLQCLCECGNVKTILKDNWGKTLSCGCFRERQIASATKHGLSSTVTYRMWDSARNDAKRKRILFNLRPEDVPAIPEICPVTGLRLDQSQIPHGFRLNNPRLDLIDPHAGYAKGNVRVVSVKARQFDQHGTPSKRFEDLVGQKFNRLTVVNLAPHRKNDVNTRWYCKCECGKDTVVDAHHLKSGGVKSCGCLKQEVVRLNRRTHGKSESIEVRRLWSCKSRAKEHGVPFNLTLFSAPKVPPICPVLGIPLLQDSEKRKGKTAWNAPSVDRIIPEEGYTPENTRIISHKANALRSNATLEESLLLAADALRIANTGERLIEEITVFLSSRTSIKAA